MASTAHKPKSSNYFSLFFFGLFSSDRMSQSKVKQIDDLTLLIKANSDVVRLHISMQKSNPMKGLQSVNHLQTDHKNSFYWHFLSLTLFFNIFQISSNKLHKQVLMVHKDSIIIKLNNAWDTLTKPVVTLCFWSKPYKFSSMSAYFFADIGISLIA